MPDEPTNYAELLAAHVEDDPQDVTVIRAAAVAVEAIDNLIGTGTVPPDVRIEAILRVGSSVYYRRTARNGIVSFGESGGEVTPMRVSKDDLSEARTLLRNWLGMGIA